MELTLSHKIRLDPTFKQDKYFRRACGTARFAYNWALSEWKRLFDEGKKPNGLQLKKEFNSIKKEQYPWTYDVTKYASQQPFIFLQRAFISFYKKRSKYPRYKKKGIHDSFYIGRDHIKTNENKVHIPILGWVRMREAIRFKGKINSAVISRIADKWFISFSIKVQNHTARLCENQAEVGVDMGVHKLMTLSDGITAEGPKPLKKRQKKLKHLQRQLSKKKKGSNNRYKQRIKVARAHYRISCIRQDALHKLTTSLTENYKAIAIEDLNIKGMMSNHNLARSISDMGFFEFRRQLEYKAGIRGNVIHIADRFYPSSKLCSNCGSIDESLSLKDRVYECKQCDLKIDRDLNAAINLKSTVSSTGSKACGEASSGLKTMFSE